jgi:hypothetical protein
MMLQCAVPRTVGCKNAVCFAVHAKIVDIPDTFL